MILYLIIVCNNGAKVPEFLLQAQLAPPTCKNIRVGGIEFCRLKTRNGFIAYSTMIGMSYAAYG